MKKIYLLFLSVMLITIISACSKEDGEATLQLSDKQLTVLSWNTDHSHYKEVSGKLFVGEIPVVGAVVQVSNKRTIDTDKNGEFTFNVDRSKLELQNIKVVSVDKATIDAKSIGEKTAKNLLALKEELSVNFPITIDKVVASEENPENVEVHAHAEMAEGQQYPSFGPAKYRVSGTIKDANGNPVEGATINLRRDGVEGFSMSHPSDANGVYYLDYVPEDDENHYFYVHYNDVKYTLPEYKVFLFPEDLSVNVDVTLPAEGTIINDAPPTLVTTTAPGAVYKGTLIGVNVPEGVKYSVSIPKKDGTFVVTLPKVEWEKSPTFFQTEFNKFMLEKVVTGDTLSSDLIKINADEPNNIVPKNK